MTLHRHRLRAPATDGAVLAAERDEGLAAFVRDAMAQYARVRLA